MTFDKFLKRNKLIADHLAEIAEHRDLAGWVDSATPLDNEFRQVLDAQERLLTAAEGLLESYGRDATAIAAEISPPVSFDNATADVTSNNRSISRSLTAAVMTTAH